MSKSGHCDELTNEHDERDIVKITPEPKQEEKRVTRRKSKNKERKRRQRDKLEVMPTIFEDDDYHSNGVTGSGDPVPPLVARGFPTTFSCKGDATSFPSRVQVHSGSVRTLLTIAPERINAVQKYGWGEVELVVDSGASETVIGPDMVQSVDV